MVPYKVSLRILAALCEYVFSSLSSGCSKSYRTCISSSRICGNPLIFSMIAWLNEVRQETTDIPNL